jgi:hypothetical protein
MIFFFVGPTVETAFLTVITNRAANMPERGGKRQV